MMNNKLKNKIKNRYLQFFKEREFSVNSKNGILKKNKKLKFATYPYIGNQYGKDTKILFIGLDIGKDERSGRITSFNERQKDIGSKKKYKNIDYNPHIAGTLVTAAYFSNKNKVRWKIKKEKKYKNAISVLQKDGIENPLAYVALTNFYKFVTQGRHNRSGSENRKYVSDQSLKYEHKLLYDEIEIFHPQIIIFQSVEFLSPKYKDFFDKLKNLIYDEIEIYIGPHPACRPPYSRIPKKYLSKFTKSPISAMA